jgi:hypothetical protein
LASHRVISCSSDLIPLSFFLPFLFRDNNHCLSRACGSKHKSTAGMTERTNHRNMLSFRGYIPRRWWRFRSDSSVELVQPKGASSQVLHTVSRESRHVKIFTMSHSRRRPHCRTAHSLAQTQPRKIREVHEAALEAVRGYSEASMASRPQISRLPTVDLPRNHNFDFHYHAHSYLQPAQRFSTPFLHQNHSKCLTFPRRINSSTRPSQLKS